MKDTNLVYLLIASSVALVAFLFPQVFLYFIAALCLYILIVTIVDSLKDNQK